MAPDVVMRPMAGVVVLPSVNHRVWPGPATRLVGTAPGVRPAEYSVITPLGVDRPMAGVVPGVVNQRLLSGPVVMASGRAPALRPVA